MSDTIRSFRAGSGGQLDRVVPGPALYVDPLAAPRPSATYRRLTLVVAAVAVLLLAGTLRWPTAPVVGSEADPVGDVATSFPAATVGLRAMVSGLEQARAALAAATASAAASADDAVRQAEQRPADATSATNVSHAEASVATGSAHASSSSSSNLSVSSSESDGSTSSSLTVSNSSSSYANSGGSVASGTSSAVSSVSGSSGPDVSSTCMSEALASTEVDGVGESIRRATNSC